MSEKWLPIPGYEGRYEVSDEGRVRSLLWRQVRLLNPWVNKGRGYLYVSLHDANDRRRVVCVHRAVLMAFVGPLPPGQVSRHLDGDPLNNRLTNLEYGTYSQNLIDSVAHGTHPSASRTHCKWGHEFTPENTIQERRQRRCRTCTRQRWRRVAA